MSTADLYATIGVSFLLLAFVLDVFDWTADDSDLFLVLNAVGASLAGFGAWLAAFWPFVVLEGIWALVSIVGLIRKRIRPRQA
ncbi:MAG: hypothetical protein MUE46_06720 [Xanthomonadales bacterium]|jgi:hypothetical protein|nr:hypothetical protein [Xanthomonadales bacterium]